MRSEIEPGGGVMEGAKLEGGLSLEEPKTTASLYTPRGCEVKDSAQAKRALELWWLGCGGRLPSPLMGNRVAGEDGPDHAYLVSLHVERYFAQRHSAWRALAKWATTNGFRMETYPVWLVTVARLFSLGKGQLIVQAPQMRGAALLAALLEDLSKWLGEFPMPEEKPEWLISE